MSQEPTDEEIALEALEVLRYQTPAYKTNFVNVNLNMMREFVNKDIVKRFFVP